MICVLSGEAAPYAVIGVTYPEGSVCTCTNGSKTLTAEDTSGKALFVIPAAGTWTVKAVKGSQSASKAVNITVEGQVATVTLAYFSATIKVTYPAKSKCVIKNSSGTQIGSDTNTGTAAKTWTATVDASGTYTVTATATDGSGKTKTTTASITANGQSVSVSLSYDYIIFSNATGLNPIYSDGGGGATVTVTTDSSGVKILKFPSGGGYDRMAYLKPAVDLTDYKTLKISGFATADRKFAVWKTVPDSDNAGMTASVVIKQGTSKSSYTIDVSNLTGNYYLGTQYATGDTTVYDLNLE